MAFLETSVDRIIKDDICTIFVPEYLDAALDTYIVNNVANSIVVYSRIIEGEYPLLGVYGEQALLEETDE